MDYSKPALLVISGPNGAGKSTFISSVLPESFKGIVIFRLSKRADWAHKTLSVPLQFKEVTSSRNL